MDRRYWGAGEALEDCNLCRFIRVRLNMADNSVWAVPLEEQGTTPRAAAVDGMRARSHGNLPSQVQHHAASLR